jgi:predicted amidophosphoribosyltransferase
MSAMAAPIQDWLNVGLGFLYPEICQLCGEQPATARDGFVCRRCWTQVRFIRPPFCERCGLPYPGDLTAPFECTNCRAMELHFSSARSAVVARGIVRESIHRYKYQRALWFEPFLADLLTREAKPVLSEQRWDFIVPVPLYPVKQREREFNQAERLASHLSAVTKIPLNKKILRRVMPTATQTTLTREQRATNMRILVWMAGESSWWTTCSQRARPPARARKRYGVPARETFASGQLRAGYEFNTVEHSWIRLRSRKNRLASRRKSRR